MEVCEKGKQMIFPVCSPRYVSVMKRLIFFLYKDLNMITSHPNNSLSVLTLFLLKQMTLPTSFKSGPHTSLVVIRVATCLGMILKVSAWMLTSGGYRSSYTHAHTCRSKTQLQWIPSPLHTHSPSILLLLLLLLNCIYFLYRSDMRGGEVGQRGGDGGPILHGSSASFNGPDAALFSLPMDLSNG